MDKKRLEEIKKMNEKARKNLADELKSLNEQQERLRKLQLIIKALDELFNENPDFRKQFESKLEELILKEKTSKQGKP